MKIADATQTFLEGYFSTCRRSAKTRAAYKIDLAQLGAHLGADIEIKAVTSELLEKWAMDLLAKEYKAVSIRRKFATARVFFAYWIRKKELETSPLWRIRLDLGRERFLPRNLPAQDAKLLVEYAWKGVDLSHPIAPAAKDDAFLHLRNLAAVEILFATGIRVGELVSLNISDWCDGEARFIINGKGSRQRLAFLPDERSLKAVRSYIASRQALITVGDALLLNAAGQRISTQGIARMLGLYAADAGIAAKLTPHMIRHTVATLLLRFGADIRVVQEVLGHASISTTQRYTYVSKEHLLSTLRARHPNHHLDIAPEAMKRAS